MPAIGLQSPALVDAAGIEPASITDRREASTRLSYCLISMKLTTTSQGRIHLTTTFLATTVVV